MRELLLLLIIWTLCPAAAYAQDMATLILVVRDGADQPVPGLALTLMGADSTHQLVTTDPSGHALFAGLHGATVTLTRAKTAADQPVRLDPTTPRDGLVLGLMPNATRTALLRLDNGLLFLDPMEVFAGTDESTGVGGISAPTPTPQTDRSLVGAESAADDPPDDLLARRVIPALLWCTGGLVALLLALIALLILGRQLSQIAR